MTASLLALAWFGLVSIVVLGLLSEVRALRARVMLLEAQIRAIKRGPDPVAIADEISRSLATAGGLADE